MNKQLEEGLDAAGALCEELRWYATRKIDLSKPQNDETDQTWGELLESEVRELEDALAQIRRAVTVAGSR